MSTEIIRRCDACHEPVEKGEELWTIGVVAVLNSVPSTPFPRVFNMQSRVSHNNTLLKDHFKDFCRPCMDTRGLVVTPNEEPKNKPMTLDELLTDLVDEKVLDAMESGQ